MEKQKKYGFIKPVSYYADYQKMLSALSAKDDNAKETIKKWNNKVFGIYAETFMNKRLDLV